MFPEGRFLEFLLAGVIALMVVGPKDLPVLLRKLGQFMAKVRAMASEFRASFDEMARQSELDELRKEVEAMRNAQVSDIAAHIGAPEMTQTFDELSQGLTDVGVDLNPYRYTGSENVTIEAAPAAKGRKVSVRKRGPRKALRKAAPAKRGAPAKAAPKAVAAKAAAPKAAAPRVAAAKDAAPKTAARKAAAKAAPAEPTVSRPRARKAAGTVS